MHSVIEVQHSFKMWFYCQQGQGIGVIFVLSSLLIHLILENECFPLAIQHDAQFNINHWRLRFSTIPLSSYGSVHYDGLGLLTKQIMAPSNSVLCLCPWIVPRTSWSAPCKCHCSSRSCRAVQAFICTFSPSIFSLCHHKAMQWLCGQQIHIILLQLQTLAFKATTWTNNTFSSLSLLYSLLRTAIIVCS